MIDVQRYLGTESGKNTMSIMDITHVEKPEIAALIASRQATPQQISGEENS
jgi:hypothetical protein